VQVEGVPLGAAWARWPSSRGNSIWARTMLRTWLLQRAAGSPWPRSTTGSGEPASVLASGSST